MEKKEEQLTKAAENMFPSNPVKIDNNTFVDTSIISRAAAVAFAKSEAAKEYHSSNDSVEGKPFDIDGHWAHIWKKARVMDVIDFLLEMGKKYNLQKQQERGAWISVEDRLPESVGWYQVYTNDDFILTAKIAVNGWWTIPFGEYYGDMGPKFVNNSKENEREVTHWMPLPNSPTIQIKQ